MTSDELVEAYRNLAIVYGQAAEEGDYRRGNAAQDEIMTIRRKLRQAGPEHARKLLALLDDESVFVRLKAGIDALRLSPEDGERVLADIARGPHVMISFEAEMTLKYWKKGEFTVPWWDD